jgi:UPF0176 protein
MAKPILHNKVNKEELKLKVLQSNEQRVTISFYKYHTIGNPVFFRDYLFLKFNEIGVFGRIYVAAEGINAQMSVPYKNFVLFEKTLEDISFLNGIRLNIAVDDDGKSFYVLKIKNRPKIVADGIDDPNFDPSNIGKYLNAEEFNALAADPNTVIVDMRNHYESEVGRFDNAWCPDVDTFREQIPLVVDKLNDQKDKKLIMYCTGGIRCEKASAYMKYKGFENVYHLEGGIIKYARDVRAKGLENKFKGKNFVFDERLEEAISDDIIAHCHQCGTPFDHHSNCKNVGCNLLFLQCPACAEKMEGCCSEACKEIVRLDPEAQKEMRKGKDSGVRIFSKGRMAKTK